uniref:Uncharacterized protein n=1 Tax=Manihot esculenta TaxID=3983 RepID=A0A199UBE5_MANES
MRRVQGASLISYIFQMVIGFSGLEKYFSRHLSPLASVPLVTLTGLRLYVAKCIEIGLPALAIVVFLTQVSNVLHHFSKAKFHYVFNPYKPSLLHSLKHMKPRSFSLTDTSHLILIDDLRSNRIGFFQGFALQNKA